jgi:hypothetical protein
MKPKPKWRSGDIYPKGKPERAFARLCVATTRLSDEKIARITFTPIAEVREMRERLEEKGRGQ